MKIAINRKPVSGPWGGGNLFVRAFWELAKKRGHSVVYQLERDVDAVFIMDPRPNNETFDYNTIAGLHSTGRWPRNIKVIHRVNECDARKGTRGMDDLLVAMSRLSDVSVFVSNWMRDYHTRSGRWGCLQRHVVYNGVDHAHFHPTSRAQTEQLSVVAHHWSDNPLKGFDVYDQLDDWVGRNPDFKFVYIGRHRGTFKNVEVVAPLHGKALGNELAKHDVYVSASRWDPGPNHIIEALASGLPTYVHTSGGGAVEFATLRAHELGRTYEDFDGLVKLLQGSQKRDIEYDSAWQHSWEDCVNQYIDIIEGM